MTHRYYANLTIAIDTLSLNQYQTLKSILFNSFSALAFSKIPNQWVFAVEASSRESAKEKITKTIAQIIATLDIPELMFTLFVSAEIVGIGTMRNKRIFSLKKATQDTNFSENKC
jgi:hypothetical protein